LGNAKETQVNSGLKSACILLVDNEEDNLRIVEKILKVNGFSVHEFIDPVTALEHIRIKDCNSCSIAISAIKMDKMTGFELVRELTKLRPQFRFLLMAEFRITRQEFLRVFPSMDICDIITKPVSPSELIHKVNSCYRRKIPTRDNQ
jgi:DNA-binding NtrC family response regulator